jgi:hypothetical protein
MLRPYAESGAVEFCVRAYIEEEERFLASLGMTAKKARNDVNSPGLSVFAI